MIKEYLLEKRNELIWSLSDQDYSQADIGSIFSLSKARVSEIMALKPAGWKSPWVKRIKLKVECLCHPEK